MRNKMRILALVGLLLCWATVAAAQTIEEIVEKHLTAEGGREALSKLKSRTMAGTLTVGTPNGEVSGTIEIYSKEPNKARTLIKLDLSSFGAGEMTRDQRFNGKEGYVIDSMQGNQEITGKQLEDMKNSYFPNQYLNYKEVEAKLELSGKEKIGERDAYIVVFTPKSGSASKHYFDAETYLVTKIVTRPTIPELGGEIEQAIEFQDYREVDGIKVPHQLKVAGPAQTVTISIKKVEHNTTIDDALFSKPPGEKPPEEKPKPED